MVFHYKKLNNINIHGQKKKTNLEILHIIVANNEQNDILFC